MKMRLCEVNAAAVTKLPQHTDDRSGIGVHYVDAYLKPMNAKLESAAGSPPRGWTRYDHIRDHCRPL